MSRCPVPLDCQWPDALDIENLRCGLCTKCRKRAKVMGSDLRPTSELIENQSELATNGSEVVSRELRVRSTHNHAAAKWPKASIGIKQAQMADNELSKIIQWKQTDKRPKGLEMQAESPGVRHLWLHWDLLEIHDGVLYRRFFRKDGTGEHQPLIVPHVMRDSIMRQMHDGLLSGHLGRRKTREKVLQRYYWYGVRTDVDLWVARCDSCEAIKPPGKPAKAPMGLMPTGAPMDRLGTDILGPLPETPRGNKYILVVTDYFSKWVEVFAVPDQTAVTCAEKILNEVVARFGTPLSLHSYQGRNY